MKGDDKWKSMPAPTGTLFDRTEDSTYVREPPFFLDFADTPESLVDIQGARVLAVIGDTMTMDPISPTCGNPVDSPAEKYLLGLCGNDQGLNGNRNGTMASVVMRIRS